MAATKTDSPQVLTSDELRSRPLLVMRDGKGHFRASVYEVEVGGKHAIWKDMNDRIWMLRKIMGAALLREARILRHLHELPGIPALIATVGCAGFVMEKMQGECLPSRKNHQLTPDFFDSLRDLILSMHNHNVAHGDLRRLNILCDMATQQPRLIDFGTANILETAHNPLRQWIWKETCRIDLQHYAKIKKAYFPLEMTAEEEEWLDYKPFYYKVGHLLRNSIYRPIRRRVHPRKRA